MVEGKTGTQLLGAHFTDAAFLIKKIVVVGCFIWPLGL